MNRGILKFSLNLIILLFSLSCIFPIVWIFYSSFKTQSEFMLSPLALPSSLAFDNVVSVIEQTKMGLYVLNSFRNTTISVVFIVLISFFTGYFLSRFRFRGRNFLYTYFTLGMLIPLHALLVPLYIQLRAFNAINQWFTLLFPYVAFGLPIGIILVESYIGTIPKELEEAAFIDGSSFTRTLFTIVLPLASPILATVAIIQFFQTWNEFAFALILVTKEALRTVPVGLTVFKSAYITDYPRLMAAIIITMLPVMILYFSFSKRVMEGMTTGAVKG